MGRLSRDARYLYIIAVFEFFLVMCGRLHHRECVKIPNPCGLPLKVPLHVDLQIPPSHAISHVKKHIYIS